MPKLAIIGDIHLQFKQPDIDYFYHSDYDLLLFTGDLGEYDPKEDLEVAKKIAKLRKPTLFIPGNHDVANYFNIVAEALDWGWLEWVSGLGRPRNAKKLAETLQPAICCGYSTHPFTFANTSFDVIAGRPFSMGGNRVSFPRLIAKLYGVTSMESSVELLKTCVDQSQSDNLIFLAHGGPMGCGDAPTDPWGKDFGDAKGDHGEPDLTAAISYAREKGKRVVAVVAGHMHHVTKQGAQRQWRLVQDGTCYLNAAFVPRVFLSEGELLRHHISLTFDAKSVHWEEQLVATAFKNVVE